jgi:uncharacterized HAD superfamily protein
MKSAAMSKDARATRTIRLSLNEMVLARNLVIRVILVQRYKKNRKKQNKTMINLANWIILCIFANEFIFFNY